MEQLMHKNGTTYQGFQVPAAFQDMRRMLHTLSVGPIRALRCFLLVRGELDDFVTTPIVRYGRYGVRRGQKLGLQHSYKAAADCRSGEK